MTSSILSEFFTFIYLWSGAWLSLMVVLMMSRKGKEWVDYEVIGFRASIAFVCLSVATYRLTHFDQTILIPALSVFGWTSMMNTIRVGITIWKEFHAHRSQAPGDS